MSAAVSVGGSAQGAGMTKTAQTPTFGILQIERPEGELVACLGHNSVEVLDDLSADDLRGLAADALAAAEWIEANR